MDQEYGAAGGVYASTTSGAYAGTAETIGVGIPEVFCMTYGTTV